jgi:hypothetical protein
MTSTESDELARIYARDGAESVIKSMLSDAAADDRNAQERVNVVIRSLEEMAEHRVDAACCLMLSLWPIADELMMHDVCDGIDLFIDDNRSPAVKAHLKHLVASEVNADIRRYFEELLSHIERKA